MSINRVVISGNLTHDAQLRTTPSGTSVLDFSVAVNERRKDQSGEWKDYPNYMDCTMFGTRAEKLQQYLVKGLKVAVEGKLHYRSWQDKQSGKTRSKLDVTVDNVEFMSRKQDAGQNQGYTIDDAMSQPMFDGAYVTEDVPF